MRTIPQPTTRPLRIFPTDPIRGYAAARTTTIDVAYEPLQPGPIGQRLEVIDYDANTEQFYDPVNLDDPALLIQSGLAPSESDPRFHQQMVYAVASRTLANFDRALGRRVSMRKGSHRHRLRLFPHAFEGENAFYDRDLHAVLFGYFAADMANPGSNIPNQTIFTCLSHDIVVHEMTHAIVDRLRRYFLEPSNVDVLAFHEGFSDIIALLQHFSYRDLVVEEIGRTRGRLRDGRTLLLELARQYGEATGTDAALRTAQDKPNPKLYATETKCHERGAILLAAVFDGFVATFETRTRDLIRIATQGSGELPPGELLPDLVGRLADEACRIAQRQLEMCIRAFDYLPPVDITFGDYLRALVTADFELAPDDPGGHRAALIEGFRRRGIYPEGVTSMAEDALRWPRLEPGVAPLIDNLAAEFPKLLKREAERFAGGPGVPKTAKHESVRRPAAPSPEELEEEAAGPDSGEDAYKQMRDGLVQYGYQYAQTLGLVGGPKLRPLQFNTVLRIAPSGAPVIELVVQFVETRADTVDDPAWGGVPMRGGTTVIFGIDGQARYIIAKPLPETSGVSAQQQAGQLRFTRQRGFVEQLDGEDPMTPYLDSKEFKSRMKARMSLRALHGGRL